MTDAVPTILICRPADLAILAVTMSGMENVPANAAGALRWRAGPDARVRLTFPPQAVAETLLGQTLLGEPAMADARLSGPSVLEFAIDAGTEIELTAEGILGAVAGAGRLVPAAAIGGEGSLVELPWGLLGSPEAAWSDETITSDHPAAPLASSDGVVGLWQSRLHAERGVAFRPLLPLSDQMSADTALSGDQRRKIVDAGGQASVPSDLVLSALGGSASFRREARDVTWSHDVTLGRDARVRVVSHGMLYPYGHRAVLVEAAERQMTDDGAGTVAGVQRTIERIVLTEHVRPVARSDFPFDAVEILAETIDFAAHGGPIGPNGVQIDAPIQHPAPDKVGLLQQQLATVTAAFSPLDDEFWDWFHAIPQPLTYEWLASEWGSAAASEYVALNDKIDDAQAEIDSPGLDANGYIDQPRLHAAQRDLAAFVHRQHDLSPQVQADLAAVPRTRDGLIAGLAQRGNDHAAQYLTLQRQIADLNAAIADAQTHVQDLTEVAFVAYGVDGLPIAVPIRCHGALGDVVFDSPVLFVDDFTWTADDQGTDFRSLTDPWTTARLTTAWQPHAMVDVPGVAVDLVRSAPTQPGDVHEVCALQLTGAGYDPEAAAYAPRLARIDARFRGWRMLLPGQNDRISLAYPTTSRVGDVALDIVTPTALDFAGRADRAGGLAVPRVAVDGISRSLGPVPTAALPGAGVEALRRVYADTRVLGFSLADILAVADGVLPAPPQMLPVQGLGGAAGVTFAWQGLRLRGNGVFRVPAAGEPGAGEPSTLDIVATIAPDHSETRCTLTRVGLVLPPVTPLVQLDFASLTCTTTPGRPPAVDIGNLRVAFLGPLQLLNGLQERLQSAIHDAGVTLDRTPDGIRAGYAVSIPDVAAGAFVLQNVEGSVVVEIPFTGRPVSVTLAFARPDNPFRLAVLAFGGGGYAVVQIAGGTVTRLDVSLDFGAVLAVDFRVASAEVHVIGGLSITGDADGFLLVAFLRMGGSLHLLGVVSVSVEVKLLLAYDDEHGANRLVGRARLVVEVDLLFFSKSLELDTGEWVIAGGSGPAAPGVGRAVPAMAHTDRPVLPLARGLRSLAPAGALDELTDPDDPGRERWFAYQLAFAEDSVS